MLGADLGADRVFVHELDPERGTLTPGETPFAQESTGAGPRHVAFHPGGRLVHPGGRFVSVCIHFRPD